MIHFIFRRRRISTLAESWSFVSTVPMASLPFLRHYDMHVPAYGPVKKAATDKDHFGLIVEKRGQVRYFIRSSFSLSIRGF